MKLQPQVVKYVLMVQDMDRAVAFYRDVLGFEEIVSTPDWSELSLANAILGLHAGADKERRTTGLSIQYADVKLAYELALNGGASGVVPPVQREGEPLLLATIADPEENLIMLTQFLGA